MKKVMNKIWTLALLTMVSTVASAEVVIDVESFTGGKIEASQGGPADDGSVVVTLTVTPDDGYEIAKSDIKVVPTIPAQTRDGNPDLAEPYELNGEDPEDLTTERKYTFTVMAGFGAWVKEATFHQVETPTDNDISKDDGSKSPSQVTWEYDADSKALHINGTGATRDFTTEDLPWESNLSDITSVVIEKGVTSLGANIFAGCTKLTLITIENGEKVLELGEGAIDQGIEIDVPGNLYNEYKTTDGWKALSVISKSAVDMTGVAFSDNNQYDTFVNTEKDLMVPSVLSAYVISNITADGLELTKVDVIPAGVPVLVFSETLKGDGFKTATGTAGEKPSNLLNVVTKDEGIDVKLGQVWMLYNDTFYYTQAGTIAKGGIYLAKPSTAEKARSSYPLGSRGGTTSIATLTTDGQLGLSGNSAWYGLDGRKYETMPTRKGIYIKNGRKVVIK